VAAALKSEHRIPTTEGRPKSEILEQREPMGYYPIEMALDSDLGLRVSFGLRSSGLGFGVSRTDLGVALFAGNPGVDLPHLLPSSYANGALADEIRNLSFRRQRPQDRSHTNE
jgi:hypothetical protein